LYVDEIHDAKARDHGIEACIVKRKRLRISEPKGYINEPRRARVSLGKLQYTLGEIGRRHMTTDAEALRECECGIARAASEVKNMHVGAHSGVQQQAFRRNFVSVFSGKYRLSTQCLSHL
jgi:hypothetical protein